jgi:hypothetical protein
MFLMDGEEHTTDEAPNHRAIARSMYSAIYWEIKAVRVKFVGDAKLGF